MDRTTEMFAFHVTNTFDLIPTSHGHQQMTELCKWGCIKKKSVRFIVGAKQRDFLASPEPTEASGCLCGLHNFTSSSADELKATGDVFDDCIVLLSRLMFKFVY